MGKEIYIDGTDVSGCEFYFDDKCRCMDASIMQDFYSCPQCNSNPNCYYKQLARKEQEYEELRQYHNKCCEEFELEKQNLIDKYIQFSEDFFRKYCKKEHCDMLKDKEQEIKKICKAFDIEYAIDEETGNLFGRCNKLYKKEQECERLKQNLAEIKEMCNSVKNIENVNSLYDAKLNGMYLQANKILQKISDVEVENGHTKED